MTTVDNSDHLTDQQLLDSALVGVREILPEGWTIEAIPQSPDSNLDPGNTLVTANHRGTGSTAAIVELRRTFTPQDAKRLLGDSVAAKLRAMTGNYPILIIAPYLSPRTRQSLEEQHVSYIDLAGDIHLELQSLFVHIERTSRNPNPTRTRSPGLSGASGGRVARVLVDAFPPYGVTEIAKAAGVDLGYTSRILERLSEEALIDREPRGKVTDVDWPGLLRARAQHLDLLGLRAAKRFVARQGARETLASLAEDPPQGYWVVTGSFAASEIAPVATPALLVAYAMDPNVIANRLELLPADEGADVVLIRPSNYGPFDRPRPNAGIIWAGLSQIALDCLSGNGRMPAEGEAVIEWMAEHLEEWRLPIRELPPPAGK